MVFTGKPSAGCENCRQVAPRGCINCTTDFRSKSKKKCSLELPCSRCVRLGKTCGGYRDASELMFRDESESVIRRVSASASASSSISGPSNRQPSPTPEALAQAFFFDHFVTDYYMSFMMEVNLDGFLQRPLWACAMAAMANRASGNAQLRDAARQHYIEAIAATNAALRHPRTVQEDKTLVAVFLLGVFEHINWEGPHSMQLWGQHVQGTSMCLQLRGRNQLRTRLGSALFRDLRTDIIMAAVTSEAEVPAYIVQWTESLAHDSSHNPADQLTVLAARIALLRVSFRARDTSDLELLQMANRVERALLKWCEATADADLPTSYTSKEGSRSPNAWFGIRHNYNLRPTLRTWNLYRILRISLSRTQEGLWRRSWPTLPSQLAPPPDHYRQIRDIMVRDISAATASLIGAATSSSPPKGSVSTGMILLGPLGLAGMSLLEQLGQVSNTPGGSRLLFVSEPQHMNPYDRRAAQLAWAIDRLEYLATGVGLRWATSFGRLLKGETNVYYDLERSTIRGEDTSPMALIGERLDLSNVFRHPE